jgi:hypothetical protein
MELNNYRDLTVSNITESGAVAPALIEVYGTSYNSTDTGAGYIKYNTFNSNTQTTYTVNGRGLTIIIFDAGSMTPVHTERFDTYGNDARRTDLANLLNQVHNGDFGDVVYAIASFDATNSNSNLLSAMETARAYHWSRKYNGSSPWNLGPYHRTPVAMIGCSSLGILKEVIHTNVSGTAPAYCSIAVPEDFSTIGAEGYGPDFAEGARMNEYSITSGYGFAGYGFDWNASDWRNVKTGEWIRMTAEVKIDLARKESGGSVAAYLYETDWTDSSNTRYYYTEWTQIERYFQKTAEAASLGVSMYHMPNSNDTGTSYARNIQVQKVGFNPNTNRTPSLTFNNLNAKEIHESPGAFNLTDPDTYWSVWNSSRNLTGRPNLGDSRYGSGFDTNSVQWFNRTLTNRNEYSIHEGKNFTGDSNRYNDVGYVNIDPNKMYVGLIWHNCIEKGDGSNYLGGHTQSGGSTTSTRRAYDNYATTNPYSMYPSAGNIEKNKWSLWSYWMLPHWMTDAEGLEFYNNNWCKWAGNYENSSADNNQKTAGNRWSNGGNIRTGRFNPTDERMHIRWLDYYNTNINHKTWWALPMIMEVDPLNFKDSNGFGWNIIEQ